MSERSKGFNVGAICLFVCAMGLLTYVWLNRGNDGPAAVPVKQAAEAVAPDDVPQTPVINAQATEDVPSTAAPLEDNEQKLTPERVKKARSIMR